MRAGGMTGGFVCVECLSVVRGIHGGVVCNVGQARFGRGGGGWGGGGAT